MKTIFVNPQLIEKIQKKVDTLAARWNYQTNDLHCLWQMVATIESGHSEKIFYDGDGIVCDGWNGYKKIDNANPDPNQAFGGFYRLEPHKMIGWSIYLIARRNDKQAQADSCYSAYGYRFWWEEQPMIWGFLGRQDYYTEAETIEAANEYQAKKSTKRTKIGYGEFSGMWRLTVETTRQKPTLKHAWKERIAR